MNDLILGIIGRAQAHYGVRIFGLVVLGNHMHALLGVRTASQLADFMRFVLGNIAREVGRHHRWVGRFWGRRYRSIVVADGSAQVSRLFYILSNGCKEGLVERPKDWPGVSCVRALTQGTRLRGTWFDRSAEYEARRRGKALDHGPTTTTYDVELAPLPVWAHLRGKQYATAVRELVREAESTARRSRQAEGRSVLGAKRILTQDPHAAPPMTARSPAPLVHAITTFARQTFLAAYRAFVDAYRVAAAHLRAGRSRVSFPENAFPPARPFTAPMRAASGP